MLALETVSIWGSSVIGWGMQSCCPLLCRLGQADRPSPVGLPDHQWVCELGLGSAAGVPFCDRRAWTVLQSDHSINWEIAAQADASCVFELVPSHSLTLSGGGSRPPTNMPVAGPRSMLRPLQEAGTASGKTSKL